MVQLMLMDKEPLHRAEEKDKPDKCTKILKIQLGCYALPSRQTELIPLLSLWHFVVEFCSLLKRKKKKIYFNECLLCW